LILVIRFLHIHSIGYVYLFDVGIGIAVPIGFTLAVLMFMDQIIHASFNPYPPNSISLTHTSYPYPVGIGIAVPIGFALAVLMFMDQSICAALIHVRANKLKKVIADI
jgi:ABC-type nitrate/sulfonate/bicarbonate transport system permease component